MNLVRVNNNDNLHHLWSCTHTRKNSSMSNLCFGLTVIHFHISACMMQLTFLTVNVHSNFFLVHRSFISFSLNQCFETPQVQRLLDYALAYVCVCLRICACGGRGSNFKVTFQDKNHYGGILFNGIGVTNTRGVKFPGKNRYITIECPYKRIKPVSTVSFLGRWKHDVRRLWIHRSKECSLCLRSHRTKLAWTEVAHRAAR